MKTVTVNWHLLCFLHHNFLAPLRSILPFALLDLKSVAHDVILLRVALNYSNLIRFCFIVAHILVSHFERLETLIHLAFCLSGA